MASTFELILCFNLQCFWTPFVLLVLSLRYTYALFVLLNLEAVRILKKIKWVEFVLQSVPSV